ncbi:MAG: MgtC/SapB family protein [Acidobacteria bacterium]|nr:MgtC/SapB family protein [Acidobacteriota bacterium]
MELGFLFQQLGIALGLGLLVGLQRESVASRLAGLRTFPLVTLFGSISALLATMVGGWVIAAGVIALAVLIFVGKFSDTQAATRDPGLTTEVAILLMFGVGAYLILGHRSVAIAVGGGAAVLLHFKGQLHGAVARLSDDDLKAIMQFALISLVILPVLPNQAYGPYAVLNPRNIWWMVVLIVGINLSGYIVYKFFGEKAGLIMGGVLGGLISSTATTVSYSRRTEHDPDTIRPAAIIIAVASAIVFGRVILEIATVAPAFLTVAVRPLAVMMLAMAISACAMWFWGRGKTEAMPSQENPSELKSALLFSLLYAVILLAIAFAKERYGSRGLYFVAGLSGLTDVDAITLSTSQMVNLGRISADQGWRLIVIATMSNLIFKALMVATLGHRQLLVRVSGSFGLALAVGLFLLLV